jgi:hypothetical protein
MKPQILGLRVASVIFGLITVAQVARLVIRPEVVVAGHLMPLWPSALAAVPVPLAMETLRTTGK